MGLYWSFIRNKYLYPRVPPFWEKNCLCMHFLQNIILWSKKERDLSNKYTLQQKNSVYTQWDYSGLSYEINIYIPEFHHFREKIAYISIIYKISSCGAKKNVICQANTYYNNKTKIDIHSRGLCWSFIRNKYLYPRVPPFWEKIAYVSIFYKILSCGAKKERDLSSKYTLQRKNSVYTQCDYSGLSNEINIYIPEFHHFEKKLLM